MNEEKLNAFVGQVLGDIGGAYSISLVRMGTSLGLYKALHEGGPMTSEDVAARTGLHERYVREWLSHHAASGYANYDPSTKTFELSPEQAAVFADENSPFYMAAAFDFSSRDGREPDEGRGRVQERRRRRLGGSGGLSVLRRGPLLPPRLSCAHRAALAAGS